jgi:tetratricopeptide (TPR) repeat protein
MLSKISLMIISLTILASCSSLVESTRKSLLGDDKPRVEKKKKENRWVSRDQYDDLMVKYKSLSNRYEKLREQNLHSKPSFDHIGEMAKGSSSETVDVFGKNGLANQNSNKQSAPRPQFNLNTNGVEDELSYYKKAKILFQNGKVDEALKLFQFLEKSNSKQIMIRAKREIGNIYFQKNQFDLALQVYEGIIRRHSFSSSVLNALKNAVNCAKQLGLTEKQAQYYSLLRDVFEVRV